MKRWERTFENLTIYIFFLILLNLLLVYKESKVAWPVIVFFLFGFAFVASWIEKGPEQEQLNAFLERKGIKSIHLWIGITTIYYGIVGLLILLGGYV